jgi:hypothetical protein
VADLAGSSETIPDEDNVSRGCVELAPESDPASIFLFPYSDQLRDRAESVYWRKYAMGAKDVHDRECIRERARRTRAGSGKSVPTYVGFRTSQVAHIRAIRTGRGQTFAVVHCPEDGDLSHAHICVRGADGEPVRKLAPNDKRELVHLLYQVFVRFEGHRCEQ